jgi:ankyrin repeat protein
VGETALYKACTFDKPDCVKLLVRDKRIKVDIANDLDYTPLHEAAQYGEELSSCLLLLLIE